MKAVVQAHKTPRKKPHADAALAAVAPSAQDKRATGKGSGQGSGRRLQVRKSGVHGKGVFALRPFDQGDTIIEYVGEVIGWDEAIARHPHDPSQPDHTFYFHLDDEQVIDGGVGGNASRWINHSCEPNVEADDASGRVFLLALHDIQAGEELFFDYGLVLDERYTPAVKKRFACHCGAADCRGSMLAPKRPKAKAAARADAKATAPAAQQAA